MRVLIIDDEEIMRDVIGEILESFNVLSVSVTNCKEGLDLLQKGEKFDVVFVDWKTPVMNGIEFTEAVRKIPGLSDLPLMMITGKTDFEDIEQALSLGVNEYLMKPFTPDMVKNKMQLIGLEV